MNVSVSLAHHLTLHHSTSTTLFGGTLIIPRVYSCCVHVRSTNIPCNNLNVLVHSRKHRLIPHCLRYRNVDPILSSLLKQDIHPFKNPPFPSFLHPTSIAHRPFTSALDPYTHLLLSSSPLTFQPPRPINTLVLILPDHVKRDDSPYPFRTLILCPAP